MDAAFGTILARKADEIANGDLQILAMSDHGQILNINVYDEDSGSQDDDDFLGSNRVAVGKILLAGGSMDVELLNTGKPTGHYVKILCELE